MRPQLAVAPIPLPKVPGQIWNMSRARCPSFLAKCLRAGPRQSAGETVPRFGQHVLVHPGKACGHLMGIMNALRLGECLKVAFIALVAGWR
jgi:hypothetical protein